MKIYRGWKDVPELAGLTRSQRRQVLRDCFFRFGFGLWQFWVGQLAILVFALSGDIIGLILEYAFGFPASIEWICGMAGVLIGCGIYSGIYYTVLMDKLRPHFREYLQNHSF
ncbi:MAG TPA: hypothetical protein VL171_06280 [Verrucomicrobiae bacterium]|nr:hypothetical protein [Verrucomicrobiae bacterium]